MWFKRFLKSVRASIASSVAGVLVALFMVGALGATAVSLAVNTTGYSAGVPAAVTVVFCVAIPIMAGVAIMLYFLPKRA